MTKWSTILSWWRNDGSRRKSSSQDSEINYKTQTAPDASSLERKLDWWEILLSAYFEGEFAKFPGGGQVLQDEFKIQDDVKMYGTLPGYDNFVGFDLSNEKDLSAISKSIFTGPPKTSRAKLKHRLFNTHIPKEVFKKILERALNDMAYEFDQERLFQKWMRYLFQIHPVS